MLPLGWHTDVAVLEHSGSTVERRADHWVVRTPDNPTYHWGNFVLVTAPEAVGDARHWLDVFETEFPDARHRAVGLSADPPDEGAWTALGLAVEHEDVLAGSGPADVALADGYVVRALETEEDWAQDLRLTFEEYGRTDGPSSFETRATEAKARITRAGVARYVGAFAGDRLVADLGIVDCGEGVARYQSVVTDAAHRRRGLASHLLGVAAVWAHARGCTRLVILADADEPPSRLYQSLGFTPVARTSQAYSPDRSETSA
jgi:GNAT superfamily N-acetyltransferase